MKIVLIIITIFLFSCQSHKEKYIGEGKICKESDFQIIQKITDECITKTLSHTHHNGDILRMCRNQALQLYCD